MLVRLDQGVYLELQDQLVVQVQLDYRVFLVLLQILAQLEIQEILVLLVQKDKRGNLDQLVLLEKKENLDHVEFMV